MSEAMDVRKTPAAASLRVVGMRLRREEDGGGS